MEINRKRDFNFYRNDNTGLERKYRVATVLLKTNCYPLLARFIIIMRSCGII